MLSGCVSAVDGEITMRDHISKLYKVFMVSIRNSQANKYLNPRLILHEVVLGLVLFHSYAPILFRHV